MADMNPVEFAQLISSEEPHSVSLLLPTHPAGRNVREDVIRLKNLVSRAETTLRRQGVSPGETAERLEPAQRLIHEEQLSQNHGRGLAVYLGQTHSRVLDTAFPLEEICTVANRFYVRPLLPMADSNGDFYLLALAQKSWRFFRGDRSGLTPEDLPGAPENLAASAHLDQPESHVQFHTGTAEAGVGGSRPAMFHGQGAIADKAASHRPCTRFRAADGPRWCSRRRNRSAASSARQATASNSSTTPSRAAPNSGRPTSYTLPRSTLCPSGSARPAGRR